MCAAASTSGLISPSRRRRDHHQPLDPGDLGGNRVHQHRRGIGRAAAGDIDAGRIDRVPARAEANAGGVGRVAVGRALLLRDRRRCARRRDRARRAVRARSAVERGERNRLVRSASRSRSRSWPSNFCGEGAQRRIAFVAHAGDDRANVARDIGIGLAPGIDQRGEIALETGSGGGEADHAPPAYGIGEAAIGHAAILRSDSARRNASTSGTTSARVLNAARLTISRDGDLGDHLDLDQAVLLQRAARGDQIDDARREAEHRRQFHRAVQLDAFGLHAARLEMAPR